MENSTRVFLDIEMICLFKLMFILYKLRGALPRWVILLGGFAELGYFTWWLVGWLDSWMVVGGGKSVQQLWDRYPSSSQLWSGQGQVQYPISLT